jgi:hypothetical protein
MWLTLYDFESESYALIENIRGNYFLCAIIDNDFTVREGENTLWKKMESIL